MSSVPTAVPPAPLPPSHAPPRELASGFTTGEALVPLALAIVSAARS